MMTLLEGQARSEDLYDGAEKRSPRHGLAAAFSCPASSNWANNGTPPFHKDECPFSTQLQDHFGEEILLARRC